MISFDPPNRRRALSEQGADMLGVGGWFSQIAKHIEYVLLSKHSPLGLNDSHTHPLSRGKGSIGVIEDVGVPEMQIGGVVTYFVVPGDDRYACRPLPSRPHPDRIRP